MYGSGKQEVGEGLHREAVYEFEDSLNRYDDLMKNDPNIESMIQASRGLVSFTKQLIQRSRTESMQSGSEEGVRYSFYERNFSVNNQQSDFLFTVKFENTNASNLGERLAISSALAVYNLALLHQKIYLDNASQNYGYKEKGQRLYSLALQLADSLPEKLKNTLKISYLNNIFLMDNNFYFDDLEDHLQNEDFALITNFPIQKIISNFRRVAPAA